MAFYSPFNSSAAHSLMSGAVYCANAVPAVSFMLKPNQPGSIMKAEKR